MSKEHPILFSTPMVNAILEGRKTQTRRVVSKRGVQISLIKHVCEPAMAPGIGKRINKWALALTNGKYTPVKNPYGKVGDRLWLREAWQPYWDDELYMAIRYKADGQILKPENLDEDQGFRFMEMFNGWEESKVEGRLRPSIYMPRWASRITLQITDVRVERVQNISEDDAEAEGAQVVCGECGEPFCPEKNAMGYCWRPDCKGSEEFTYQHGFRRLWDSINAKRGFGWDANPWVWVIEFKQVEASQGVE